MEDVSREFGYSEMTLPFKLITVMYFSITASFFVWNGVSSSVLVQLHGNVFLSSFVFIHVVLSVINGSLFFAGWSLPVATVLVSFTNFIVGTSPLFGHFVDRYGGRTLFFTFGSFLLALSFFAIGHYQDQSPALWYITMGLSVAIMQANVLSAVPLIISERVSAQGYAVLSLVNNFGMLVLPPLVGYLRSTTGSFNAPIQLFTFIASLSFVCSLVFIVLDRKSGGSVFQTQSSSKRGSVDPSRDIFM
jgi:MFS family permease